MLRPDCRHRERERRMRVEAAQDQDYDGWLDLASELEPLTGPLQGDPTFRRALLANIARGTAFCVREDDGPPGARLLGGLLLSPARPDRPEYRIGLLVVGRAWRRHGIGRLLVEHALGLVEPLASVSVVTFGDDSEAGRVAGRFYERLGFRPAGPVPPGPEGGSRRVFRRDVP
jgi:GNAT superfamily N-acetyltransferase